MKQLKCAFHTNQNLVNFCRSSQCLLPMCPSCVKIHSLQHLRQNTHGNYDCISDMYIQVQSTLQSTMKALITNGNQLKQILNQRLTQKSFLNSLLKQMRTKILDSINKYIDNLEQEVYNQVNSLQKFSIQQFTQIDNQIQKVSIQAQSEIQNLHSQKSIKAIIHHISANMPAYYGFQLNGICSKMNQFRISKSMVEKEPKLNQISEYLKIIGQIYHVNVIEPIKRRGFRKVGLKDSNVSKNYSSKDSSTNNSYKKIIY